MCSTTSVRSRANKKKIFVSGLTELNKIQPDQPNSTRPTQIKIKSLSSILQIPKNYVNNYNDTLDVSQHANLKENSKSTVWQKIAVICAKFSMAMKLSKLANGRFVRKGNCPMLTRVIARKSLKRNITTRRLARPSPPTSYPPFSLSSSVPMLFSCLSTENMLQLRKQVKLVVFGLSTLYCFHRPSLLAIYFWRGFDVPIFRDLFHQPSP